MGMFYNVVVGSMATYVLCGKVAIMVKVRKKAEKKYFGEYAYDDADKLAQPMQRRCRRLWPIVIYMNNCQNKGNNNIKRGVSYGSCKDRCNAQTKGDA